MSDTEWLTSERWYLMGQRSEHVCGTRQLWTMDVSDHDGRAYGKYPVILSRGAEFMIGSKSPYGSIMVYLDGEGHVEEPITFWTDQGWVVTYPPVPGRATEDAGTETIDYASIDVRVGQTWVVNDPERLDSFVVTAVTATDAWVVRDDGITDVIELPRFCPDKSMLVRAGRIETIKVDA